MAKPKKLRPIRFDQFEKQLHDLGIDDLQPVELSAEHTVYIALGIGIDATRVEELQNRIEQAEDAREAALVILDYHPERTAEDQLALVEEHGRTPDQLVALWGAATADMRDRMGKLRPQRS